MLMNTLMNYLFPGYYFYIATMNLRGRECGIYHVEKREIEIDTMNALATQCTNVPDQASVVIFGADRAISIH